MKKRLLILMTVTGMIILLGGLLTYGLGVHEIIPVHQATSRLNSSRYISHWNFADCIWCVRLVR